MLLLCFCFSSAFLESRLIFVFSFIYFFFASMSMNNMNSSKLISFNGFLAFCKNCVTPHFQTKPFQLNINFLFISYNFIVNIFTTHCNFFVHGIFYFSTKPFCFEAYVYVRKILWNVNKMMIMYILEQTNNL